MDSSRGLAQVLIDGAHVQEDFFYQCLRDERLGSAVQFLLPGQQGDTVGQDIQIEGEALCEIDEEVEVVLFEINRPLDLIQEKETGVLVVKIAYVMDAEVAEQRSSLVGYNVHHHTYCRAGDEVQHPVLYGDDLAEMVEHITDLVARQALKLIQHDYQGQPNLLLKDA